MHSHIVVDLLLETGSSQLGLERVLLLHGSLAKRFIVSYSHHEKILNFKTVATLSVNSLILLVHHEMKIWKR